MYIEETLCCCCCFCLNLLFVYLFNCLTTPAATACACERERERGRVSASKIKLKQTNQHYFEFWIKAFSSSFIHSNLFKIDTNGTSLIVQLLYYYYCCCCYCCWEKSITKGMPKKKKGKRNLPSKRITSSEFRKTFKCAATPLPSRSNSAASASSAVNTPLLLLNIFLFDLPSLIGIFIQQM